MIRPYPADPDLYDVEEAVFSLALDQEEEGDDTLLRHARLLGRLIEQWDQDPCDPDTTETWDGDGLANAPKRLIALSAKLPAPYGVDLAAAVRARQAAEQ